MAEPAAMGAWLGPVRLVGRYHRRPSGEVDGWDSLAVAEGVPLHVVDQVLGHWQVSTTEIYAHLGDDPLRAAVERTVARIAGDDGGGGCQRQG